jgi:tripartite-type tricarboxylate transporter receptor subunit TctC
VTALGAFVRDGKARALVQTGAARHALLPDTPTVAELGQPGFQAAAWIGILVPSATPDATVMRFNTELKAVLQDVWVKERMAAIGVQLISSSPGELGAHIKSEMTRWSEVVQRHNIKPE